MIRSLRRRFILIAMVSLTVTLAILCAAVNIGYRAISAEQADTVISLLYQYEGDFPAPTQQPDPNRGTAFQVTPETSFETRYFIVRLSPDMDVLEVDMEHIAAIDRATVTQSVQDILATGRTSGYSGQYRYGVFNLSDGSIVLIVLDRFLQLQAAANVLWLTIAVSLACIFMVFVFLIFLSKKAIRPFVLNLQRQKQFVTDASHELKTPLAIISADAGLLEGDIGENRWLRGIQDQVMRMDTLIKHLIELARTEETDSFEKVETVSLSSAVQMAAEDFASLAQASEKELIADIAPDVNVSGQWESVVRLLDILLDNAVKYCAQGGRISLALRRKGRWACLTVSNPCDGLDASKIPRLFDRFYRGSPSRENSPGGYGIGLSTARAITQRQHGRISARIDGEKIKFTVLLPLCQTGGRAR